VQVGSLDLVDGLPYLNSPPGADSLTKCTITGALAEGGAGGSGGTTGTGGAGGLAQGGGIAVYFEAYPNTFTVTISSSTISDNASVGGAGGSGAASGDGGDAQGGGIWVGPSSMIALSEATITGNAALGGSGAVSGTGVGGGVYLSAGGSTSTDTTISGNSASTIDDNVYGTFS
jgi:hypothetical protein